MPASPGCVCGYPPFSQLFAYGHDAFFARVALRVACVRVAAALIAAAGLAFAAPAQAAGNPAPGTASEAEPSAANARVFNLPSLPLHDALLQYTRFTGRSVIYDVGHGLNRRSSPVRGRYTPDAALRQLLAGSGMAIRLATAKAVSLLPESDPGAEPPARIASTGIVRSTARPAERRRYYGQLQDQLLRMLCAHPGIEIGRYRMALRFRITAASTIDVLDAVVAESPDQEPLIHGALEGQPLDVPPAGFGQPVTMLLTPEAARREGGCGS